MGGEVWGRPRPIADQCQYNMLERTKVELDYNPLFDDYKYGTTIWSPLASGILTGKYNNGIPAGSRFDHVKEIRFIFERYLGEKTKDQTIKKLQALSDLATELGMKLSQLAIAWVVCNKDVSTCILGASSEAQLKENLEGLKLKSKITKEVERRIEDILQTAPTQETNFINWQPLPGRRGI